MPSLQYSSKYRKSHILCPTKQVMGIVAFLTFLNLHTCSSTTYDTTYQSQELDNFLLLGNVSFIKVVETNYFQYYCQAWRPQGCQCQQKYICVFVDIVFAFCRCVSHRNRGSKTNMWRTGGWESSRLSIEGVSVFEIWPEDWHVSRKTNKHTHSSLLRGGWLIIMSGMEQME